LRRDHHGHGHRHFVTALRAHGLGAVGVRSDEDDGGGSAGEVAAGGVAGLSIGAGGGGAVSGFGAGRSGPLMPHAATPQLIASASAIVSALRRLN
jgi:hypothetical protein